MKHELLVPAGDMESLKQAVANGADAVYVGCENFGARKFAKNFTNDEMLYAIKLCHLYGVRIYATMNTLIKDDEVLPFLTQIEFLYKNGIDAVLVQDFANKYPEMVSSLTCIGGYDINNFTQELQKDTGYGQKKMMFKALFSIKAFAEDNKKISAYTEEAQEKFYQMNLRFRKSSFRYLASLGKMINKYQTKERSYPLLIGVGNHDNEMAKKASMIWYESEPQSEYVEFEGAGHIVNMDTPEQFNKVLKKVIR